MLWNRQDIYRVIQDLIVYKVVQGPNFEGVTWLDEDKHLLFDSLNRVIAASRVAQLFNLPESMSDELLQQPNLHHWSSICTEHLNDGAATLTFSTSGTTGREKFIQHSIAELQQEALFWAKHFDYVKQVLCNVPGHHIYGFIWTVILPGLLDIVCRDIRKSLPIHYLPQTQDSLLVCVPEQVEACLAFSTLLNPHLNIVVSTAPCAYEKLLQLATAGVSTATQIYGSTETGGVGYRNTETIEYTLPCYLSYHQHEIHRGAKKLETQDNLRFLSDRTFEVLGRKDNAIQVNGYNIQLEELEKIALSAPLVEQVSVRAFETAGINRLKAFVVPNEENTTVPELFTQINALLPDYSQLSYLSVGTELPKNNMGKVTDWEIDFHSEEMKR